MKKNVVIALVCACIVCASSYITFGILNATKYHFSAESVNGKVNFSDFNDTYKVVYFGYTFCPDVCPLSLYALQGALKGMEDDVLLLFVSLDPKRDIPRMLQEYVEFFYPHALGLWIDEDSLRNVCANFGITYQIFAQDSQQDYYSIAHSSALFLFDKKGRLIDKITNLTQGNIRESIQKGMGKWRK